MIVRRPTTITIDGMIYEMRAGTVIPAPVLTYWKGTGELLRLQTMGAVIDEKVEEAQPKRQSRKKDDAESL